MNIILPLIIVALLVIGFFRFRSEKRQETQLNSKDQGDSRENPQEDRTPDPEVYVIVGEKEPIVEISSESPADLDPVAVKEFKQTPAKKTPSKKSAPKKGTEDKKSSSKKSSAPKKTTKKKEK